MSESRLYKYHNGEAEVWADPLVLHRKLIRALDGDVNSAFQLAQAKLTPGENGAKAEKSSDLLRRMDGEEKLARAAYKVFDLLPVDPATGKGVSEVVALKTLYAWSGWMQGNGQPAESSPT